MFHCCQFHVEWTRVLCSIW